MRPNGLFSTKVSGKQNGNQYDLKIVGDLTLHGVTRQITIPTKVTVTGNDLRAQGEFSINRGDFKVKATSAFHGLVRVLLFDLFACLPKE